MRSPAARLSAASASAALIVASVGCSSGSSPASDGAGATTTATTSTGQGGSGGSGGAAGAGGTAGEGGAGGQGGGGGGGVPCVAEAGTGQTAITGCGPLSAAPHVCGPAKNEAPPASLACFAGFSVLSAGAAEALAACLVAIPEASRCDPAATEACRDDVFARVCEVPAVAGACENVDQTLCAGVDVAACVARMRAFSNQALVDVVACVQAAGAPDGGSCQSILDGCIDARAGGL